METVTVILSLYDRSRRAEVTMPRDTTVGELMRLCSERWSLPALTFVLRLIGSDELLLETDCLRLAGVRNGAELQVFPIVEGG